MMDIESRFILFLRDIGMINIEFEEEDPGNGVYVLSCFDVLSDRPLVLHLSHDELLSVLIAHNAFWRYVK